MTTVLSDNLVPSADIIAMQKEKNKEMEEEYEASKIKNITLETAIKDIGDAVKGILEGILGNGEEEALGLWEIFSKDNRLRGLGLLFILISSVVLFIRTVARSG